MIALLASSDANDADDELRNHHARAAQNEDLATAESLDDVESEGCGEDVDECCDEGYEKGVFYCAKGLEEYNLFIPILVGEGVG